MAMTKQQRSAYNRRYYQRRKANGGKRLTKLSTTKSAIYQRKRRANIRRYNKSINDYRKALAKIDERIRALNHVSPGSGTKLGYVKESAKSSLKRTLKEINDRYQGKPSVLRNKIASAYNLTSTDLVEGNLNANYANIRYAKNRYTGLIRYMANRKHSGNNLATSRAQKSGNLRINYSNSANKKQAKRDVNTARKWVAYHGAEVDHLYEIVDTYAPELRDLSSDRLEELVENEVSIRDHDFIFEDSNDSINTIVDSLKGNNRN